MPASGCLSAHAAAPYTSRARARCCHPMCAAPTGASSVCSGRAIPYIRHAHPTRTACVCPRTRASDACRPTQSSHACYPCVPRCARASLCVSRACISPGTAPTPRSAGRPASRPRASARRTLPTMRPGRGISPCPPDAAVAPAYAGHTAAHSSSAPRSTLPPPRSIRSGPIPCAQAAPRCGLMRRPAQPPRHRTRPAVAQETGS